jgi:SPP1 family predicted phage head-tail adaptor
MPRARKFNKIIDVWKTTTVEDGFGGNTVNTEFVDSVWAKVETGSNRFYNEELGTVDISDYVKVTIRNNPSFFLNYKTNFIKYLGTEYTITENSINVDFSNNYVTFKMLKQNEIAGPVGVTAFDYNLNFKL